MYTTSQHYFNGSCDYFYVLIFECVDKIWIIPSLFVVGLNFIWIFLSRYSKVRNYKRFKVLELTPSCMTKNYHISHFTLLPFHYSDSIIIKIHLLLSPNYIVKWWTHNLRSTGTPISDIQIDFLLCRRRMYSTAKENRKFHWIFSEKQ